ncbi:MAG: DUF2309 domain-containing protein [Saprospiraceae bacterium]|nr:DUF2309 domain-containing protein [Saprospiraceae bacterium]
MSKSNFDLHHTLHEIAHFLPSQMTLKDFVHHNTLHAFQDEKFYEGIFRASKLFGYKVTLMLKDYRHLYTLGRIKENVIDRIIINRKGSKDLNEWKNKIYFKKYDENIHPRVGRLRRNWKDHYKIDIDSLVHPLMYRILCAYLDQGISIWNFPIETTGFLDTIRMIDKSSAVSFFKTSKVRHLLQDKSVGITDLLKIIVGDETYFEQYLFDMSFNHTGWSGIISVLDENPNAILIKKPITFEDYVHFELLMELDTLYNELGNDFKPLTHTHVEEPLDILAPTEITELDDVFKIWQDSFEWSYYDDVINALKTNIESEHHLQNNVKFQAIFCIDERECSLRRHIELVEPNCETLGAPGFFGVEFYYRQQGAKFIDKLCPAPVTPKYLIKEYGADDHKSEDIFFSKSTYSLIAGFFQNFILGAFSIVKIFQALFSPKMSASISDSFAHMSKQGELTIENKNVNDIEDGLQVGFTIDEMTSRIQIFLRGIGLINNFSSIIYVMSHGSSSANNPHHGAHDCGACSGRPGAVNARVFAFMANHPEVRKNLRKDGIDIPDECIFIPAMHDTASDLIGYYDDENLNEIHKQQHVENKQKFESALDLNAKERSRRFASIDTNKDIKTIRRLIEERSVSLFEPRPELGHGTNSLAIIGRRSVTKGLFLDRRAFMNSYNYLTDLDGKYLTNVMAPIGVVCGGINLEYYFSRVDNLKLGCGTKLPHNVMGLIGVANSSDGDLRPGLPWQMIEPHDPVRLLVIVEHFPEIVLKVIKSNDAMLEWYKNEWVHLVALHPETKDFFYYKDQKFNHHHSMPLGIEKISEVHELFEKAPQMLTNHISHATFENLPIYQIENNFN